MLRISKSDLRAKDMRHNATDTVGTSIKKLTTPHERKSVSESTNRATAVDFIIFDDDTLRQEAIRYALLHFKVQMRFVGAARTATDYQDVLQKTVCDIAIISLDNLLWLRESLVLTKDVSERTQAIGIVNDIPDAQLKQLLNMKIMGIVSRSSGLRGIMTAIDEIAQRRRYIDPAVADVTRMAQLFSTIETTLTLREEEILRLLSMAWKNSEIASHLYLSVDTIKSHLQSIYKKFAVRNRHEAVIYAKKHGII